jgi:cytochrome c553
MIERFVPRQRTPAASWALVVAVTAASQAHALGPGSVTPLQLQQWAASCMACHGTDGRAEGPAMRIAGRPAPELAQALLDFKHGRRRATVMHHHVRGYSDEELRLIAGYFARQTP